MVPVYTFVVGDSYSRKDIYRRIGISEKTHGGNWDTGYCKHANDYFVFANIGVAGRTGHLYENSLDGNILKWEAKKRTRLAHKQVKELLNPPGLVYIFYRKNSRTPFTFAGTGKAISYEDTSPVKISWCLT